MSCQTNNNQLRKVDYTLENDRLQTFARWTRTEISMYELAKYGWYFTGSQDLVKCAFCGAEKYGWILGDHPLNIHVLISPGCPLLLRRSQNQPILPNFEDHLPPLSCIVKTSNGRDEITLTGPDAVLHPDFRSYMKRFISFNDWPKAMRQTPSDLSDAGFFYLAKSDQTKCFCCGGVIENWDISWDPWEQHIHRFEDCEYVQKCNTPKIIESVRAKFSGKSCQTTSYIDDQNGTVSTKQDDNDNLERQYAKKCGICLNEELNCIFFPCMHIYTCVKCGFSVTHCPVCRQKIEEFKKCYIYQ